LFAVGLHGLDIFYHFGACGVTVMGDDEGVFVPGADMTDLFAAPAEVVEDAAGGDLDLV